MALDFYNVSDRNYKNILFQLNGSDLEVLQPVLIIFQKQTGLYIDQYTDQNISKGYIQVIIDIIDRITQADALSNKHLKEIREKLATVTEDVKALGD